jgi:hypothetical protein
VDPLLIFHDTLCFFDSVKEKNKKLINFGSSAAASSTAMSAAKSEPLD